MKDRILVIGSGGSGVGQAVIDELEHQGHMVMIADDVFRAEETVMRMVPRSIDCPEVMPLAKPKQWYHNDYKKKRKH